MTSAISASSEGAQGIFSKITFSKSVHSNEKDEVCHSFLVEIFTKSLHRGGVKVNVESFLGFALLIHHACFIVPLIGILGVSPERHSWRNILLHNDLWQEYRRFFDSTSIFFHGYFSLHLPFSRGFSITV